MLISKKSADSAKAVPSAKRIIRFLRLGFCLRLGLLDSRNIVIDIFSGFFSVQRIILFADGSVYDDNSYDNFYDQEQYNDYSQDGYNYDEEY